MAEAYLGLGSNLRDKRLNLTSAVEMLKGHALIEVLKTSSFYETEPVGYKEQDWFINMVVKIATSLNPYELLEYCQSIEEELKRKRVIRWGPRTIDVDILLYESFTSQDPKLTVPHPRIKERAFVLAPLAEVEPDLLLEGMGVSEILKQLHGQIVKRVD